MRGAVSASPSPGLPNDTDRSPDDRLDSWKEIANYVKRDVKSVQRWEKREGMPVHRHVHDKIGSVYAFRSELDAWAQTRKLDEPHRSAARAADANPYAAKAPALQQWSRTSLVWAAVTVLATIAFAMWQIAGRRRPAENPLDGARFIPAHRLQR